MDRRLRFGSPRAPAFLFFFSPARTAQMLLARSLALLVLLLAAAPGQALAASIAFVQSNSAIPQSPQTTVTVTYTAAQTLGNLNVVVVGWNNSTSTVSSVTDSLGNAYV